MVIIPPICDKCHGVEPRKDANKINSPEEFREAIAIHERIADSFRSSLRQKVGALTGEEQSIVLYRIFELAAEDVANMSDEEINQELKEDGVDVQAIRERLLEKIHKVQNEK